MGVGPVSLGYCYDAVDEAIKAQLKNGITFSLMHPLEVEVAEIIREAVPQAEMVRFSKTGCDVTSAAVRLARAYTNRSGVLCCGYHGWHDWYIGATDRNDGVPQPVRELTRTFNYNDLDSVVAAMDGDTACVILEPLMFDFPTGGFLSSLREICEENGTLLIFDEMWTGFRLALGGAQQRFSIKPDLTTLGKIIGAGLPMAAYGGRADVMNKVAPVGPIYQAGTLSGNPLAVSAGIAMLRHLKSHPEIYETVERRTAQLTAQVPPGITINRVGSMFTFFFSSEPVTDWESAKRSDTGKFKQFFHWMLDRGVYLAPSQFEAGFVSSAHTEKDIARTVAAAGEFFDQLK
jgi:glutamate-1-semialdehyde-2,1-aminomutase